MLTLDEFSAQIPNLHSLLDVVASTVEDIRERLVCAYRCAEKALDKIPADSDIAGQLHWRMGERFGALALHLKKEDVEICPM